MSAQELAVITSFQPRMTDAYMDFLAKGRPASEIRVLHKIIVAAIGEIARGDERRFDNDDWLNSVQAEKNLNDP